jgi:MoxR-like ATPase
MVTMPAAPDPSGQYAATVSAARKPPLAEGAGTPADRRGPDDAPEHDLGTAPPDPGAAAATFDRITRNIATIVQGKTEAIELAVACLVAEGHLLIEDVPGVGKTSLGKALAASVSCSHRRIQFTSDLLPSDVTGTTIFNRTTSTFEFRHGPIFANLVLGDEINRTPPKTQSALLEAMEEQQVTIDTVTYPLPEPFMVIATQNPIEHEGTYPLPTSELDRFLIRVRLGYPGRASEIEMLDTHGTVEPLDDLLPVASKQDVLGLIAAARATYCSPLLQGYIVDVAAATRSHPSVALGMSPRAALALQRAGRSWAAMHGRDFVSPDDLKFLAVPVLGHRMALHRSTRVLARDVDDVINEVLERVPVPRGERRGS